uniref:TIMELESS-interacting protein n=1 Tax=Mola mola TaxID=94237 RepID=A0A3Q3WF34_MOLML
MSYDYGMEDEVFPPLPPPLSPGQGGQDERDPFENGKTLSRSKSETIFSSANVLFSSRLISDRGLPALRTLFDDVRFKGKGHEAEDLQLLMKKMENWAHRLFPKLQFEDFIDRVEKLGKKKEVQTCLKRIRLDMPLTHEDYTSKDEATPEPQVFGDPDPFNSSGLPDDLLRPVHSTPAPAAPSLTEEQRRRMELNRQLALERKLARQQQHTAFQCGSLLRSADPTDSSTAADEPTSADALNTSTAVDEEAEDADPDPASRLPHKDSEPAAPSPEREDEEETGPGPVQRPSSSGEDEHPESENTM